MPSKRPGLALAGAVSFALLAGTAAAAPAGGAAQRQAQVGQTVTAPASLLGYKLRRRVHARVDPHTILVRFGHGAAGLRPVRELGDVFVGQTRNATVVRIQPGESPAKKVAQYRNRRDVAYAEPNYVAQIDTLSTPNDPRLGDQWGYGEIDAIAGWSVFPASYAPADPTPTIAIVDTGIASAHEDLGAAKVLSPSGANCVTGICKPWPLTGSTDDNGHGTHVAGIAAAATDNGTGVAGVAYASKLLPVKVCDAGGSCPTSAIVAGINWAVSHGAKVINMSLGGPGASTTLCGAVSNALSHGVFVAAASGNDGTDVASYPAACSGAVGVAAVGPPAPRPPDEWGYDSALWSNWGFPNTFISAPGGGNYDTDADGIWSTVPFALDDPGDTSVHYASEHGTSMASPFVAGAAALLFGQAPTRTPADVKRLLAETATKIGGTIGTPYYGLNYGLWAPNADPYHACTGCTWHGYYGYGEVSLAGALTGPPPVVSGFTPASATIGSTVTISGQELSTASSVKFSGGATATPTVVSSSSIRVVVRTGATTGTLQVTTTGGTDDSATALKIAPKVDPFLGSPAQAGDLVTINGSGFDGTAAVKFGTVTAETPTVNPQGTQLSVLVPDPAVTGKVTVTTAGGTAVSPGNFPIRPTISLLKPDSGAAGTQVEIDGKTLVGVSSVKFSGTNGTRVAAAISTAGGVLKATVPAAAISGPVFVTNAGGTSQSASFTVLPRVLSIAPALGAVDTPVTVTGTGFDNATVVKVNGTDLTITSRTATQIKGTIAAGSTTGNVTTTGNTGGVGPLFKVTPKLDLPADPVQAGDTVHLTGSNLDDPPLPPATTPTLKLGTTVLGYVRDDATHLHFTVPDNAVSGKLSFANRYGTFITASNLLIKPTIDSPFSPAHAVAGTGVTIPGKTFTGTTSVKFNGVAAAFSVAAGVLKATVPAAATTGPITVTNAGGPGTSGTNFVVDPKVTTLSPTSGRFDTLVTITGSGFGPNAKATFTGGFDALPQPGSTATVLKVKVPGGATTGPITVSSAPSGVTPATAAFKVGPAVLSFDESPVHAGQTVHVHGWNLNGVTLAKLGALTVALNAASDGQSATFLVPDAAVTAPLTVTSPGGAASSASLPVVAVVDPGAPAGNPATTGTPITFNGTFAGITSVRFAGPAGPASVSATPTLVDVHHLKVTIPGTALSGTVEIRTAGGPVLSAPVTVLPKVTSFSPTGAVAGSSTLITINGSGFQKTAGVKFHGVDGVGVQWVSPTQMKAKVPNGATAGAISVANPDGPVAPSATNFNVTFSVTGLDRTLQAEGKQITISGVGITASTKARFPWNTTQVAGTGTFIPGQLTVNVPGPTDPVSVATGPITLLNGSTATQSVQNVTRFWLDPANGPTGTSVHVHGAGISVGSTVTYAGSNVGFTFGGPNDVTLTVPDGASTGPIAVDGTSATFTVTASIIGLDRTSGAAGDEVVISGVGFTAGATVSFGGVQAAATVDGPTQITATVPDGAASGDVTVTTAAGTVSSAASFAVTGGAAAAATDSPQFAAAGAR